MCWASTIIAGDAGKRGEGRAGDQPQAMVSVGGNPVPYAPLLWANRRLAEGRPDMEQRDETPRFSATESMERSMAADYRATVLIVDDDHVALDGAAVLLESLGYKAFTARSDHDALGVIRRHSVDILFTDIVAGTTVDGPELARLARQINPAIAVVYTTRARSSLPESDLGFPRGVKSDS